MLKNTCHNPPKKPSSPITDDHDQSHWFMKKNDQKRHGWATKVHVPQV